LTALCAAIQQVGSPHELYEEPVNLLVRTKATGSKVTTTRKRRRDSR
jgi:ABC-type sugar transport system ATPase subunit